MAHIIRVFLCFNVLLSVVMSKDIVKMQQGVDDNSQNIIDSPGTLDQLPEKSDSVDLHTANKDGEQDKTTVVNRVDESTNGYNGGKSKDSNSEQGSGYNEPSTTDNIETESPEQHTPDISSNNCENSDESCDNEINQDVNPDCNCSNPDNWAHLGTCNPAKTGVDISIAWCPRYIHNFTVCPNFMIKTNKFNTGGKTWNEGGVLLTVFIPDFERAIYNATTKQNCSDVLKKLSNMLPPGYHLSCPINLDIIKRFAPQVGNVTTFHNPFGTKLPTLPAGSYHLQSDIYNDDKSLFLCLDGWIEFKI